MNFNLSHIPERTKTPRNNGLTMVMDKGLSVYDVEGLISIASDYIDLIKLGFGTSYVTPQLKDKLRLYIEAGIPVYFGGTLFEAFLIRNQLKDYISAVKDHGLQYVEVSDGSIDISHQQKCDTIQMLVEEGFTVLSEVGSKDVNRIMPPYQWIDQMQKELNAGSSYVIAEARESGNIGIYRGSGEVREGLIQEILRKIPSEKIIWEAPHKSQQLYFIEMLGCNANLGNIASNDILSLEAMRVGLRGDTFHLFLK